MYLVPWAKRRTRRLAPLNSADKRAEAVRGEDCMRCKRVGVGPSASPNWSPIALRSLKRDPADSPAILDTLMIMGVGSVIRWDIVSPMSEHASHANGGRPAAAPKAANALRSSEVTARGSIEGKSRTCEGGVRLRPYDELQT